MVSDSQILINDTVMIFFFYRDDKPNGIQSDSVDAALSPTDQSTIKKVWSPTSPKVTSNGFPGGDSDVSYLPFLWNSSVTMDEMLTWVESTRGCFLSVVCRECMHTMLD